MIFLTGQEKYEDKQLAVELPDGSTTKDLIAKVADKLPQVDLRYVLILVNDELIYVDRVLADGDVVRCSRPLWGLVLRILLTTRPHGGVEIVQAYNDCS